MELVMTALAGIAVGWTLLRLPRFWRAPRPVAWGSRLWLEPEQAARAVPVLAALGTPLLVAFAVVAWVERGENDGIATWAQALVTVWLFAVVIAAAVVGRLGRPRFAVPPELRGDLRDARFHDAVVHELAAERTFMASCECGWVGGEHTTEVEARVEAEAHTSRVRAQLDRVAP